MTTLSISWPSLVQVVREGLANSWLFRNTCIYDMEGHLPVIWLSGLQFAAAASSAGANSQVWGLPEEDSWGDQMGLEPYKAQWRCYLGCPPAHNGYNSEWGRIPLLEGNVLWRIGSASLQGNADATEEYFQLATTTSCRTRAGLRCHNIAFKITIHC